jgi:hypothetical protein
MAFKKKGIWLMAFKKKGIWLMAFKNNGTQALDDARVDACLHS